jgi:hypothetical protein
MIFKLIAIGLVKASFAILVLFYSQSRICMHDYLQKGFEPLLSDISILKCSIFEITLQKWWFNCCLLKQRLKTLNATFFQNSQFSGHQLDCFNCGLNSTNGECDHFNPSNVSFLVTCNPAKYQSCLTTTGKFGEVVGNT